MDKHVREIPMGIYITDQDGDDFMRQVVSVTATRDDGVSRTWKVPRRLMMRSDVSSIVFEELIAEAEEAFAR